METKEIVPQDIFHYTKLETALERILPEKKLRLNQMGLTNDPRESKPWDLPKPYLLNPKDESQIAQNTLITKVMNNDVPKVMREEWKVLCFTVEHSIPDGIKDPIESAQYYYHNHGYTHPRMWAQYSENHRGVCLWLDGNKLHENLHKDLGQDCKIFYGEVKYNIAPGALFIPPLPRTVVDDIQELGSEDAARKYVFDHYEQFFLRKYPDWEAEAEFRWLVHSKKRASEFVSVEGAIKGVLVGVDFPKVYEPSLRILCKDLEIPAGRITWPNGTPIVEMESIYKP